MSLRGRLGGWGLPLVGVVPGGRGLRKEPSRGARLWLVSLVIGGHRGPASTLRPVAWQAEGRSPRLSHDLQMRTGARGLDGGRRMWGRGRIQSGLVRFQGLNCDQRRCRGNRQAWSFADGIEAAVHCDDRDAVQAQRRAMITLFCHRTSVCF